MRFKDLTAQDKQYIKTVHSNSDLSWQERMSMLTHRFNASERGVRYWIKKCGFSEYKEVDNLEIRQGKLRTYDLNKKRFLFTWAQNATPVHKPFWDNILAYAKFLDAEVGVLQGRYKNPNSQWTEDQQSREWWDETFSVREDDLIVSSYLDGSRTRLHKYVEVLGDVKIQATATNPLNQLEGLTGERTSIVGHPRVHMQPLAVLEGHHKKTMYTTGSVTLRNFTDSKSGKLGEFHFVYGFCLVEIRNDEIFYVRQVTANNDGSFIDLFYNVDKGVVSEINSAAAFVMGDIHVDEVDEDIVKETVSFFKKVRPKNLILHDLMNGTSVHKYEERDPIKKYQRFKEGRDIVKKEVQGVFDFIERFELLQYNITVANSNHPAWLDQWISNFDWKKDVRNSEEYMEYALTALKGEAPKGLFAFLLERKYGSKINCPGLDDSFTVKGIELGNHGFLGANGSKGNMEGYRKLNTKMIVGDWHQNSRRDNVLSVGAYCNLRQGYNHGPSSWNWGGAIVHENGKSQNIQFGPDKKFTTFLDDRRDKGVRELDKRSRARKPVGKNIRRKNKAKAIR